MPPQAARINEDTRFYLITGEADGLPTSPMTWNILLRNIRADLPPQVRARVDPALNMVSAAARGCVSAQQILLSHIYCKHMVLQNSLHFLQHTQKFDFSRIIDRSHCANCCTLLQCCSCTFFSMWT